MLVLLFFTKDTWFSYDGKIVLNTYVSEHTEITANYRNDTTSKLLTATGTVNDKGQVHIKLKGKSISYIKIVTPENLDITKTVFLGKARKDIVLNDNNEYSIPLKNPGIIHWWCLIILAGLGYYIGWSLTYVLKNGIPLDDKKLPKMLNIEFLRIVFTLGVVWHHFAGKMNIWNKGELGVELFFILSGFLLFYTFRPDKTVGNFIMNKWIRFMPLTLLGGLLVILFVGNLDITLFIRGLFFIPNNAKLTIMHNGSSWYLVVLFWLSLLYFYLLKYFKRESVNVFVAISSILASVFVCTDSNIMNDIINVRLMRGIACMGIGYFLVYIYQQLKGKEIIHQFAYNTFEICVFLFAITNIFYKPLFQGRLFACLTFALVILMFILKKGVISKFFEKPIFAIMARYSLAVYLTHGAVIRMYMEKHKEFCMQNSELCIPAIFISAILLGIIAHHMIEIPATRILTKCINNDETNKKSTIMVP